MAVRVCERCGRAHQPALVMVIEAEQEDLRARAAAGTLHLVTCPHCGTSALPESLRPAFERLQTLIGQGGQERTAVKVVDDILGRLRREDAPWLWGYLHGLLGQLLIEARPGFRRAKDVERALEAYAMARDVHADDRPIEWTWAQKNLALAYLQRPGGDRAANLRLAIDGLTEVANRQAELGDVDELVPTLMTLVDVLALPESEPNSVARMAGLLDTVVRLTAASPGAPEFTVATDRLRALLTVADLPLGAAINETLGGGYLGRAAAATDEQGAAAELAIHHLGEAVQAYARLGDRERWATASIGLGQAYYTRISDRRADDLDDAIVAIETGLQQLVADDDPETHAMGRRQLALAYMEHPTLDRRWDLARAQLGEALKGLEPGRVRALLLQTLAGIALREAHATGEEAKWREAQDHLTEALAMLPRTADRWAWAEMQNELLSTMVALAVEHDGAPSEEAVITATGVLDVYTLERAPRQRRTVLTNLGALHASRGNWPAARNAYRGAIEASERALDTMRTERGLLAEASDGERAYAGLAHALAMTGAIGEAYVAAERAGLRMYGRILAVEAFGETNDEDRRSLDTLRQGLRFLHANARRPLDDPDRMSDAEADERLRATYRFLAEWIDDAGLDAMLTPEFLARCTPIGGATVVPVIADFGAVAFVVPDGATALDDRHLVRIDGLTAGRLHRMLVGTRAGDGWIILRSVLNGDDGTPQFVPYRERFDAKTAELLAELSQEIVVPVVERLAELGVPEGTEITIVGQGPLGQVPLHAAPLPGGQVLLDRHAVSYAASLMTFALCHRRADRLAAATTEADLALAVVNPTHDLDGAQAEADALSGAWGPERTTMLQGDAATVDAVVARAPGARYLHFASHGHSEFARPFESGLVLAGGELLTVDWIGQRLDLRTARLVVLSACDSGVSEFLTAAKEALGLPSALIEAGAAGVVGSLWSVADDSTVALMRRFYELHLGEGVSPASALRAAQLDARDHSTYDGPYQWAPFFVAGA